MRFLFLQIFSIGRRYRKYFHPKSAALARTNGARVGFESHTLFTKVKTVFQTGFPPQK